MKGGKRPAAVPSEAGRSKKLKKDKKAPASSTTGPDPRKAATSPNTLPAPLHESSTTGPDRSKAAAGPNNALPAPTDESSTTGPDPTKAATGPNAGPVDESSTTGPDPTKAATGPNAAPVDESSTAGPDPMKALNAQTLKAILKEKNILKARENMQCILKNPDLNDCRPLMASKPGFCWDDFKQQSPTTT